jgi:integrase/recombinase XerD
MKHLTLKTIHYQLLIESFGDWLQTLGYSKATVYSYPLHLREFLYWLESHGITEEQEIRAEQISNYIEYFKNRKNRRKTGGLSISHVNKQIDTINKLFKYLHHTGKVESSIKVNYLKEEKRANARY